MRVIVLLIVNSLFISLLSAAFAATIVAPVENQQVEAGSWITLVVKPATGEQWQGFSVGFKPFQYDPVNKVYKLVIQVPNDTLGYRNDLEVYGIDIAGNEVELKRRIFVKLPANVVLNGISAGEDIMVLYKAPSDSTLEDKQRIETDELSVAGLYSDGVKRSITSSALGTTYVSSDEKIVTVDSEGRITSQGLGRAQITVRNNKYTAEVKVVVKPYKK